ncbi:hypothetical protein ATL39_0962 [Sinobaca qinghaiensis]|uniref:Uncharacterized protein n=1 Tax=Sinobaca qinghaiensis TaxID=342944 RepID=A0A419V5K1_9BACL|nr:hypothetical protein [Sinobaca qinghaiensis]RKD75263.1 hypothetical protein ATL39_0962 [Sinobaca qinghaiensis]
MQISKARFTLMCVCHTMMFLFSALLLGLLLSGILTTERNTLYLVLGTVILFSSIIGIDNMLKMLEERKTA